VDPNTPLNVCKRHHVHNTVEGVTRCNAEYYQKRADKKLAMVGNKGPKKFFRRYDPPQTRTKNGLTVLVWSEDEIPFNIVIF
jgi:hypothetical protein